jgi:hypothetical protein
MINVNQITSQLARMPDPALQKYAEMHKNDPYVMALAMSEFNRRKQMRQGAQANAPEQPKVVDQAIQSMAAPMPEDVGIGQLPAGNMNFAEGGIVAFGDGGEVERYNGEDSSLVGVPKWMRWLYANESPAEKKRREQLERTAETNRRTIPGAAEAAGPLAPEGSPLGRLQRAQGAFPPGSVLGMAQASLAQSPAAQAQIAAEAAQRAQSAASAAAAPATASGAPAAAAPNAGAGGPRQNTAGRRNTGTPPPAAGGPELLGGPGAGAAPAAGLASLPRMPSPRETYQSVLDTVPLVDPAAGQREALGSEMLGGAERRARALKEDIAKEGDVFAVRGERIGRREAKLKDYESTNQSLALLNAGLAVMSTPGGLATALGKGARVGTEQYAAGLDKIRAAQERLEDARDNLDALRLNRADMNRKEVRAAEADIDRAKTDAKKLGIEGIMAAADLRHKQASELFKGTLDQAKAVYAGEVDLRGRQIAADASLAAARASAGAQRNLFEALGSAAPDSPLRKGYEMFKQEGQIPRLYTEYTKLASDPINGAAFEQKYPTFEAFIAAKGGGRAPGFVTPPKNAPVLRAPGT